MAAVPKRKHSTRRKGKRRAAIKLKRPARHRCRSCGKLTLPHQLCRFCHENKTGPAPSASG